jgi:hypothetical protein
MVVTESRPEAETADSMVGLVSSDVENLSLSMSESHPESTDMGLVAAFEAAAASDIIDHAGQHPELIKMCVIDANTLTRIVPNSDPVQLDNECFSGQVMLMIRTPDVDEPNSNIPLGENATRISNYMKGKLRRFEFQFRVKLKKVPTGPLFLGCELEHQIKIGKITKSLTGVLLAMIRKINSGFHYSWGVEKNSKNVDPQAIREGNYEKTHLSFPVEASMDRIVITKPGESPPELGHELFETPESVKRRRKMGAGSVDWNLEDTYTMCLWSAYCDWIKWKCLNVSSLCCCCLAPFAACRSPASCSYVALCFSCLHMP